MGVEEKQLGGARAKWVLRSVKQFETCAGGPTHQPAKDSAALLRVSVVEVCTIRQRVV